MKRVEKRYVPQQESYRSLPVPSPVASPVDVVPEITPDPTAEKLRQITEGLSGINKGLTDYFRMEKSFEETTRAANKVNALLGLPPVGGPGNLDYGKDYGYQEGLGLAQGASLKVELEKALKTNNYFIDPTKLSSEDMQQKINQFTQSFLQENLGELQNNPAFMSGAAQSLAEAKVTALVKGQEALETLRLTKSLENWDTFVGAQLSEGKLEGYIGKPAEFREEISRLLTYAPKMNLGKDAAGDQLLAGLTRQYYSKFSAAHDAEDIPALKESLGVLKLLKESAALKDSSGVFIGGIAMGGKKSPIDDTIKEINELYATSVKSFSSLKERVLKEQGFAIRANMLYDFRSKGLDPRKAEEELAPLRLSNPKEYLKTMDFMFQVERSGTNIWVDPELMSSLREDKSLDTDAIVRLVNSRVIGKNEAKELGSIVSERERETLRALSLEDRRNSLLTREARESAARTKATNADLARKVLRNNGIVDETVVSRVTRDAQLSLEPLDETTVTNWVNSTVTNVTTLRESKKKPSADTAVKDANRSAVITHLDLYMNKPSDSQKAELNRRVAKKEPLPSDAEVTGYNLWYQTKESSLKAEIDSGTLTTEKKALKEQLFHYESLFRHPLTTVDQMKKLQPLIDTTKEALNNGKRK